MSTDRTEHPAGHLVVRPSCAVCGAPASWIELVPPGGVPVEWNEWSADLQRAFETYRNPTMWRLLFRGIERGNGLGDDVLGQEADRYRAAFSEPLTYERVHLAGLYDDAGFCEVCDKPYCTTHWSVSKSGYGHCPQGHGKSLDPHWSPDDYD